MIPTRTHRDSAARYEPANAHPIPRAPRVSYRVWFPIALLVLAAAMAFLYFLVQSTPVDPDAVKSP